jgi:hypothetical protein
MGDVENLHFDAQTLLGCGVALNLGAPHIDGAGVLA